MRTVLLLPCLLLVASCGAQAQPSGDLSAAMNAATAVSLQNQVEQTDAAVAPAAASRQVIYRATIHLSVTDFPFAERQIVALVKKSTGYIADYREQRLPGTQRGGQWSVRVPVAEFDAFLEDVAELGIPEQRDLNSQDVTEEYIDLESRLKNKQALESRLLQLVADRAEIKDVLALEAELSRVREEIERMQGRLRYLRDRVALTSVEISAYEQTNYQPPQTTFAGRIATSFYVSLDCLRQFLETGVLVVVTFLPWAALFAVTLAPLLFVLQRRSRRRQVSQASAGG